MKAVILVGGEGTRLRPLTVNVPKPMVPIVNKPFLQHMVEYLRQYEIRDIVLGMCYLPDRIRDHFGDGHGLGVEMAYVMEDTPLGTAGAIKNVQEQVGLDDTVFVFNGDVFTNLDLKAMLSFHREKGAMVTIALTPVEDPTQYGVVEMEPDGRVQRFIEKPPRHAVTSNLINAGTYIVEQAAFDHVPSQAHYMFENGLFPTLLQKGERIYGFPSDAYWIDIGTPQRYVAVHQDLLRGKVPLEPAGQRLQDEIWADEGCRIDPTAQLVGPVVLGKGCVIGPGVRIVGPTVLGEGCEVGGESTIEEAIIWHHTRVQGQVTLKSCVIGDHGTLEEGVTVTEGAIVGDHVTIGAGNRLARGIRVWPGKKLEPHTITF